MDENYLCFFFSFVSKPSLGLVIFHCYLITAFEYSFFLYDNLILITSVEFILMACGKLFEKMRQRTASIHQVVTDLQVRTRNY